MSIDGGRLSLTFQGPFGVSETYQAAWWQAQYLSVSRITEKLVFTA